MRAKIFHLLTVPPPVQHYKSHNAAQKPSFMFLDIVFKAAVTAGKS